MKTKYYFFFVVILLFLGVLTLNIISAPSYEKLLSEYQKQFPMGADIREVKSYLKQKGIEYSVENKEDFTVLSQKYIDNKFNSVLVFNAYSDGGTWKSFLGETDFLIEIGFNDEEKVINVSSEKINTFL